MDYSSVSRSINSNGFSYFLGPLDDKRVSLKLIAWDDRPEMREDDIGDISEIIKNYFHFNSEAIFEHHNDLFTGDNDLDEIASQYLGREIGTIISRNPKLTERIIGILEDGLTDSNSNKLDESRARKLDRTIDFFQKYHFSYSCWYYRDNTLMIV